MAKLICSIETSERSNNGRPYRPEYENPITARFLDRINTKNVKDAIFAAQLGKGVTEGRFSDGRAEMTSQESLDISFDD